VAVVDAAAAVADETIVVDDRGVASAAARRAQPPPILRIVKFCDSVSVTLEIASALVYGKQEHPVTCGAAPRH